MAELLVVIAILGIVLALLVPAVQMVRESANRAHCASNLSQIGLAAHQFQNDNGRLPPGYVGPSLANNSNPSAAFNEGQWVGHLPLLLPYLEQTTVFRQIAVSFDPDKVAAQPWFGPVVGSNPNPANYAAAFHKLKIFRCPSAEDYDPQVSNSVGPGNGGTIIGLHVFHSESQSPFTIGWKEVYGQRPQYRFLGRTNYMGVAGCGSGTHPFFRRFEGLYTNRSRNSLAKLTNADGTSNTLLYGETCGTHWVSNPGTMDISWMAGGALGTYRGLYRGFDAEAIVFSSNHRAGVQFCFADRSVRLVRFGNTAIGQHDLFTPDWRLLQQLAGRHDGGMANAAALLD